MKFDGGLLGGEPSTSYAAAWVERLNRARDAQAAARRAIRASFERCALLGRWVRADWHPAYPLPRKLMGFQT